MVTRDNDEIRVLNVRFGQHSVHGGKNPVDIRQDSNGLRHTTSLPFWHAHPLAGRRARKRDGYCDISARTCDGPGPTPAVSRGNVHRDSLV